jgi:hypothetical protein
LETVVTLPGDFWGYLSDWKMREIFINHQHDITINHENQGKKHGEGSNDNGMEQARSAEKPTGIMRHFNHH